MKHSNPSQSMDPTPFEQVDGELVHSDIGDSDLDRYRGDSEIGDGEIEDAGDAKERDHRMGSLNSPETALDAIIERNLKEYADLDLATDEIDHERLYTDNFIRANEHASRVLFLSFLGTALIGTAVFAWFIVSQPKEPQEPTPTPGLTVPPNAVPNFNPEGVPGSNLPGSNAPNAPFAPGTSPSDSLTQPPLFPVNPANPNPVNPNPTNPNPTNPNPTNPQAPGVAGSSPNGNNSTPLIPEGTVPPPPPQQISPDSGTATP